MALSSRAHPVETRKLTIPQDQRIDNGEHANGLLTQRREEMDSFRPKEPQERIRCSEHRPLNLIGGACHALAMYPLSRRLCSSLPLLLAPPWEHLVVIP